jgi:chromosome segregation ATPase
MVSYDDLFYNHTLSEEDLHDTKQELNRTKAELNSLINEASLSSTHSNSQISRLDNEIVRLNKVISGLRMVYSELGNANNRNIRDAAKMIEQLKQSHLTETARILAEKAEENVKLSHAEINRLNNVVKTMEDELKRGVEIHQNALNELGASQSEKMDLQKKVNAAIDLIAKMKSELTNKDMASASLQNHLNELTNQMDNLNRMYNELQVDNDDKDIKIKKERERLDGSFITRNNRVINDTPFMLSDYMHDNGISEFPPVNTNGIVRQKVRSR